jgi:hypothetical protein
MTDHNISDDELVLAWYKANETYAEAAVRLGVSSNWILSQWKRLRALGKLPSGRHRNLGDHTREARPRVYDNLDGRPSLKLGDPLMDRLELVHGDRRYEDHPATRIKRARRRTRI